MMWIFSLVALAVFFLGFSYWASEKAMKVRQRRKDKTPADYDLPYQDVEFSKNGNRYTGWMVASSTEPLPTIVFVHGWESSSQGMLPHVKFLHDRRWNAFVFDARGHGDSDPADFMNLIRFSEDLEAALDYLKTRPDVDTSRIVLFGHSMGASTSITVAARRSDIAGVVASSPFARFDIMTRDRMRPIPYWPMGSLMMMFWKIKFKVNFMEWNPVRNISRVGVPLFLAFGDQDELFSVEHFEELNRHSTTDSLLVHGGKHRDLYEYPEYQDKIRQFIEATVEQRAVYVA